VPDQDSYFVIIVLYYTKYSTDFFKSWCLLCVKITTNW